MCAAPTPPSFVRRSRTVKTKTQLFYEQHPEFDWQFYLRVYADVRAVHQTEAAAIEHYAHTGSSELRRTHEVVPHTTDGADGGVGAEVVRAMLAYDTLRAPVHVSPALAHFAPEVARTFHGLKVGANVNKGAAAAAAAFFGVYTDDDVRRVRDHVSGPGAGADKDGNEDEKIAFVVWGGEDVNDQNACSAQTLREVRRLPRVVHLAISDCILGTLGRRGVAGHRIDLSFVRPSLFFPLSEEERERAACVYVYNGRGQGGEEVSERVYGKHVYDRVMRALPGIRFILSRNMPRPVPKSEMRAIYAQCRIALRLTPHDGNANTVQECACMGIPVVHNFSPRGLRWRTADDVARHVAGAFAEQTPS